MRPARFAFSIMIVSVIFPVHGLYAQPPLPSRPDVILLVTTSFQDTGLGDLLIAEFGKRTGYRVRMIALGTGAALKQGAVGEGDVLLAHAPELEKKWMADGNGASRKLVKYNDFVVVGPADDPARVRGQIPGEAFRRIAERQAVFVSRGDQSGTHVREMFFWKAVGIKPKGRPWYRETGLGQGLTLDVSSQHQGYAITDRATFLVQQKRLSLTVLVENHQSLLNLYHVMTVNKEKFPKVNAEGGQAFADFLTSPAGQELIGGFGKDRFGRVLFTPAAHLHEDALLRSSPTDAAVAWDSDSDFVNGFVGAIRLLFGGDAETWGVIRQSLLISVSATFLSLIIGIPLGTWLALASFPGRRLLLTAFNTGFGLPPVVVGLVLSILLIRHGPLGWLGLRFTPAAMIIAQFILSCPIVIGLTEAAIQQHNPKLRLQMQALGASRGQMLWLLGREARLSLLAAYMAAFGSLISEVGASLMVGGNLPGSTRVLTTAIVMETGMGHYDRAMAYGIILLLLVLGVVGLLTWLQQRGSSA